ncbi:MAG: serine--tRNA ligase, partial [Clostridiales bacterium]|nr:serine--tRNA ligase [Clostridiales bacterium]
MLDIKFVRDNPEVVKQNIKNKFQDEKLPLVDQVIDLYAQALDAKQKAEALQANRNTLSKQIGMLKGQAKKNPALAEENEAKIAQLTAQVTAESEEREALLAKQAELDGKVREIMLVIPNIIDPSVPIGPDDSCNVEVQRFGEPKVPDFDIPYHTDIMGAFNGIDLTSARRVSGTGFYYLIGDIARLHEAVLAYARDFMIDRGFTYVIPPYMIRGEMVEGVMSFPEMDAMMY